MKLFDKKTAQVLMTALVFALFLLFLYAAWRAIIAFLFAVFFAYVLDAPVNRLQKWLRGSRMAAIAVVYLLLLIGLTGAIALVGPAVAQEAQTLMQKAPEWTGEISSGQIAHQVGGQRGWSTQTQERVEGFLSKNRPELIIATQTLVVGAAKTLQNVWWLFLVPILAIFFLKDGSEFGQMIIHSVRSKKNQEIMAATVEQMNSMLGGFIRSQLFLAGMAMVVVTFTLWAMGVPYAFAVGPAAGILEFIPVVGPIVGGALVLGVGLFAGYHHLVWVLVFLVVWRCIQDYVTSPRIMGRTLALHPLAVLFGVFAGGEVAGVIGVFLSIPVLATLRILWHTMDLERRSPGHVATQQVAAPHEHEPTA
ncbi:MAG TPA: AI-2E family transporter [Verrucomicrobiae bacterium]|nr:AI-2E family transporter [Verrucomicrobiae bacterium]